MVAMPLKQIKCQCCLKTFDEGDKLFMITEKVKTQFKVFTQLEVRNLLFILKNIMRFMNSVINNCLNCLF